MANRALGQVLSIFSGSLGIAEHIKLGIYSRNAVKTQERLLKGLMKKNKTTVYGKKTASRTFTQLKTIKKSFR